MIKRITIPSYVQLIICACFWGGMGFGVFKVNEAAVIVLFAMATVCSAVVILMAIMIDRLYLNNIRESLDNLDKLNNKLRAQRHEYLNEMQVVYGLLEIGEYEEAKDYLKPIYEDIASVGKALKTSKPAVNALLQAKMELAKSKNIKLFIEVSSDISGVKLEQWDLCKILANIIDNAITALESWDIQDKQIHVHITETQDNYVFTIYNNGPVIPKDKLPHIFKNGFTSKLEEGHGLGLGIVKSIVDANKGIIMVESVIGKTSFVINLPK
ncbi:MAG: Spo0B domain-containing protein [Lachnospira sp.]|nr:Spo0B domain-containing protein [Lachnospira sp.]